MSESRNIPKVRTTNKSLDNDKCIIDGEKYPLVIGQIVKLIQKGEQPRICILADPGHGKTYTFGRIGEILHDELNLLDGEFKPDEQITQDPETFVRFAKNETNRIIICPDADGVFPSDEWYSPKNKANKKTVYLTRRTGNLLGYDSHELSKTDKAIRTNHNIRLVSVGGGDTYKFKAEYIQRSNDSLTTDIIKKGKGMWTVDKPQPKTVERIEELDSEEKQEQLAQALEDMQEDQPEWSRS